MARMRVSMKWLIAAIGAAAVMVLIGLLLLGDLIWTEHLWYQDMGHASVLWTRLISQGLVWLIATIISAGAFFVSGMVAGSQRRKRGWFTAGLAATALLLGGLISWNLSSNWMTFRLAVTQSPFGILDPQFGKDVGFFVFTLPALELANAWVNGVIAISAIVALAISIFPEPGETRIVLTGRWDGLRPLLSVLLGALILSATFGTWLSIWKLDFAQHSQFTGASYADVHASIPALWAMVGLGLATGIAAIAGARTRGWRLLVGLLGTWALVSLVLGGAWPSLLQEYVVAPNEATLEAGFLERNIAMTQLAFGLSSARTTSLAALENLGGAVAERAATSLGRARVWTPSSVEQAYSQLQTIRPYYKLSAIETDRYVVGGTPEQVLVAARQIDPSALPARARTWVNEHLVYTHGYGLAMSSASETTQRGFPRFLVGDVPPSIASDIATGSPDLTIDEARIYLGPDMTGYAIVNTGIDEFDYPDAETNARYHNDTGTGVSVGSGLRKLAWAVRLGSAQVLLSDYMNPDSQIVYHRNLAVRVKKLAPWLTLDENPYPAIVDGRIVWILDGFTSSDHFPYSQALEDGTNYLRDSVKVTVDAASGETHLYASGDDPIRDAWAAIHPGLIEPESAVPASLAAHFRVPEKYFSAQADIYRTYHMSDSFVFYNREDQWEFSGKSDDARMKPSYVMLQSPGDARPGMHLVQPYSPLGNDNLVGWMAESCEPDDFGRQTVYLLPKSRIVLGPRQVKARIDQDPTISPTLSLWSQRGNKIVFGDMLVLPVEESIAYVQPIFLQAKDSSITELAAVVVVNGDRVEMDSTLSGAVQKAFGATETAEKSALEALDVSEMPMQ